MTFRLMPSHQQPPPKYLGGMHSGLMIGILDIQSVQFGFEPFPATLCCVFGQRTLLSQYLDKVLNS